jgi:hypothetical protein
MESIPCVAANCDDCPEAESCDVWSDGLVLVETKYHAAGDVYDPGTQTWFRMDTASDEYLGDYIYRSSRGIEYRVTEVASKDK